MSSPRNCAVVVSRSMRSPRDRLRPHSFWMSKPKSRSAPLPTCRRCSAWDSRKISPRSSHCWSAQMPAGSMARSCAPTAAWPEAGVLPQAISMKSVVLVTGAGISGNHAGSRLGRNQTEQQLITLRAQCRRGLFPHLFFDARTNALLECISETGLTQIGPPTFDRRSEVVEHMGNAAFAARQMQVQERSHQRPAQTGAVSNCGINIGRRGHALLDQMKCLAPQCRLQTIGDMAFDFLQGMNRFLADGGVKIHGPLHHLV